MPVARLCWFTKVSDEGGARHLRSKCHCLTVLMYALLVIGVLMLLNVLIVVLVAIANRSRSTEDERRI